MSDEHGEPHPSEIDVHVGRRVRSRRKAMGISQSQLAEGLGLTFQQVQKYENGANRISASKLYLIAKLLKVPIGYFFEGLDDPAASDGAEYTQAWSRVMDELLAEPKGQALAEAFVRIRRRNVKNGIADLVQAIATGENTEAS